MSMLQIRNLPEELHAALAERARREGVTMSEYVTRLLQRDLSRPTMSEWLAECAATDSPPRPIDVMHALDQARIDYDPDDRHSNESIVSRR